MDETIKKLTNDLINIIMNNKDKGINMTINYDVNGYVIKYNYEKVI
jgi:hypothetical protein